jgi:hypothetical protein
MRIVGRGLATVVAGALALLVAGCGLLNLSQAADGPPNPCTLLTDVEVASLVGFEAFAEPPEEFESYTQCTWLFSDPTDPVEQGAVVVTVWDGREFYGPEAEPAAGAYEPVSGIGEVAHRWEWDPEAPRDCAITFRQGDLVVEVISLYAVDDMCLELAEHAAGRL